MATNNRLLRNLLFVKSTQASQIPLGDLIGSLQSIVNGYLVNSYNFTATNN